jgi:hypothetical protein
MLNCKIKYIVTLTPIKGQLKDTNRAKTIILYNQISQPVLKCYLPFLILIRHLSENIISMFRYITFISTHTC